MKKIVLALSFAAALGGCATFNAITGATVSQNQVDAARSGYDGGFLAGLHRYALLPRCASGQTFLKDQCHNATTLRQLHGYDKAVGQDFDGVQANLSAGNNSALMNSWTILTKAIQQANSALSIAQQ